MAKTRTKRRPATRPAVQAPTAGTDRRRLYARIAWIAVVALAAFGAFWIAKQQAQGPKEAVAPPPTGLPETPDYHSLLVDPNDPRRVLLGTHVGVYETSDAGRTWTFAALEGNDAMNLAQPSPNTIWLAGHNVLKRSVDGGATWEDVRPEGLPGLDIHGFAVDPRFRDGSVIYAAVAGKGLYRSDDSGERFEQVSKGVGPGVFGISITASGRVLAADPERGLFASDDDGRTWRVLLEKQIIGVAAKPGDPETILAAGEGIFRSDDGGGTWRQVRAVPEGAWPVAWAPSEPDTAYVIGLDRTLYRTSDAGVSWQVIG